MSSAPSPLATLRILTEAEAAELTRERRAWADLWRAIARELDSEPEPAVDEDDKKEPAALQTREAAPGDQTQGEPRGKERR